MIKMLTVAVSALGALLNRDACATTWAQVEVPDPIVAGAVCLVNEPVSSGSYVYHWPSKYDQVFWPLTDEAGMWHCGTSGYVAFMGDFDELSKIERERIAAYLKQQPATASTEPDFKQRLRTLEAVYALRDKSEEFRITLLRVLAYQHESRLNDVEAARAYRQQALDAIKLQLGNGLSEALRLEYLFVAAAYERELGDPEASDRYRNDLAVALRTSTEHKLKDYVEYLQELSDDLSRIGPGGALAPAHDPVRAEEHED